jgi:hypothetical protein
MYSVREEFVRKQSLTDKYFVVHCRRREEANGTCGALFYDASVTSNGGTTGGCWIWKVWDESRYYLSIWLERLTEALKKKHVRIAGFLTQNRTDHLPNISPERYRLTSLWVVSWDQFSASKCASPFLRILSEIPFGKIWLPYSYRFATCMQAYG